MSMTPWAYTEDMSVPFNVARAMLCDNDPETAVVPDARITSTLTTFGWQRGMAVLLQQMITVVGQEVMQSQEQGAATYRWDAQRLEGLKMALAQAQRGVLPDPTEGPITIQVPGSITLTNAPQW